jgi:hypothetical protein
MSTIPTIKLQAPTSLPIAPQTVAPQTPMLQAPAPTSTSNDRQPANITTAPTTPSPNQNLQVLDPTGAWITMGTIDAASHTVSGLGGQGVVYVTQPNIGMRASTPGDVFDNGPLVGAFNTVAAASNSTTIFPGNLNGESATYYFTQALDWTSHGILTCQGADYYAAPVLAFAPGKDGVSFDNGYVSPHGGLGEGTLDGCRIISLGMGSGGSSEGTNFITNVVMPSVGPIPGTTWEPGDGIIATSGGSGYVHPHYPAVTTLKHGAYVASVTPPTNPDEPGPTLTLGAGFTADWDTDNTLYNFKYSAHATSSWAAGALTIPVDNCVWGLRSEVHDMTYSPTKLVGYVVSCDNTTHILTLKSGALVASSGSTDKLNVNLGTVIIRLPVELAYNTTTQGPIDIVATAGWSAGATTISVPSGSCTGIMTGDMLSAASGTPAGYGALVLNYSADPNSPWLLGSVKSCVGTTMTFDAAIPNASTGANDTLISVSRMMMISGGDGTRLNESDYIWSDAFELGNMVTTENWGSPANGGTETMVIHGASDYPKDYSNGWPASGRWAGLDPNVKPCPGATPYPYGCIVGTKTNAAGSGRMWKLPSGFHKRVTSDSRNISPRGFFIGYEDVGNGAQGAAGRDWGNYIVGNMIGRVFGGDDIAPNNEYAGMYGGNTIFDIASMETVSGTSYGTNTNSAEGGSAFQSIMNCSGHSFIGTYSSDFTWWVPDQRATCMSGDGTFSVPPMPGYKTIRNGGAGTAPYPNGGGGTQFLAVSGGTYGQTFMSGGGVSGSGWGVSNYNMGVATVSATSPAKQSILKGMPSEHWIFPGLAVRDVTTPAALGDGAYILRILSDDTMLLDRNIAQDIPSGDQLQFFTPQSSGGACINMTPAFVEGWGLTFDLICNTGGVAISYDARSGMWGLGYGQGNVLVGIPSGLAYNGASAGLVFPNGFLLGGAVTGSPIYGRSIRYDYQGPVNYHTNGTTALYPFAQNINQKLILNACDYPATTNGQAVLDTSLSGNPIIAFTKYNGGPGCVLTPVLVLAANASQASVANMDVLTVGSVTVNAADFFSTYNNAFPIADCTGITNGATVKDTSISGSPTIGTVSRCESDNVLSLTFPVQSTSAGLTDSLLVTANKPGDITLNVSPTSTVGSVEKYVGPPSGAGANDQTYPYPFGLISGDTNGATWPVASTALAVGSMPACDSTHNGYMQAVVYNGLANPTYLQVVGTIGGPSPRRVFCDGTAWKYD